MFTRSCIGLLTLALASAACAQTVANPEYENWSRFKPGTTTKLEAKSIANGSEIRSVATNRLIEVSPDKLVIESTNVIETGGQKMESPTVRRDVPAKIDQAIVARSDPAQSPEIKQSEETRTLNGKSYVCKVLTQTIENNGMKSVSKTWHSPEVPGGMVASQVKISGTIDSTTELNLVEFSVPD